MRRGGLISYKVPWYTTAALVLFVCPSTSSNWYKANINPKKNSFFLFLNFKTMGLAHKNNQYSRLGHNSIKTPKNFYI